MRYSCKLCWIILSLFLLGNLVLLGIWWYEKEPEQNEDVRRFNKEEYRDQMRGMLLQNTSINEEQFEEMYQLWQDHSKQMYKSHIELDSLRQLLMNETFSNNTDTIKIRNLMNQLAFGQQQIEEINYQHFRKLRNVCETDEQREMLDKLLRSRIMKDGHRKRFRGRRKNH
ncbi:hypothetical protein KDU71_17165 [Carboxylicivirga sediminis]|uniref:Periplasmic heavy metal sensor n=1 Tax=Carboxylicivirga sediminis TaxID=2006564 RepID=A0A941F6H9_9BACT|nr:hypothetical protein [Carboxylicivirga sediminis]MBR8537302.1 hypothetical protein [Carboxylicivirga sediminis]